MSTSIAIVPEGLYISCCSGGQHESNLWIKPKASVEYKSEALDAILIAGSADIESIESV